MLLGVAAFLAVTLCLSGFLLLKSRKPVADAAVVSAPPPPMIVAEAPPAVPEPPVLVSTNVVTIRLGEDESGDGLTLVKERDGHTDIESIDGVAARVVRLAEGRKEQYFYFRIDDAFKQEDVRHVRIDVEYLDPQPGSLLIHYTALDGPNVRNAAYRDVTPQSVRLAGSGVWQRATFHTRNDAAFDGRQNGRSDFRLCAKTPILYVRRVTVTREAGPVNEWPVDYSTSNSVSLVLGEEKAGAGLRHLSDEGDGRTIVTNLDGVACRYLNLVVRQKLWGEFYFDLSPSFKREGLARGRIEVEYLSPNTNGLRLQFNGIQNGRASAYVPVLPVGTTATRELFRSAYALPPSNGVWTVAVFEITNATFPNTQNGGADFRVEVVPPEMYVRRVTVIRENR